MRHFLPTSLLGLLTAAVLLLMPAAASADSSTTLTVVGTSDVSDSGLVANVIQPDFDKAYPQYTFKYEGFATGTAINDAESGSVGASALIVHAASLENQFVAGGYSYEQYGRAIFTNDFVLAGPKSDPAGVDPVAAHDIAQAFADVATAGINGGGTPKVTFVSRGGTPGTTVAEHGIWALVAKLPSPPAGLLLCRVNAANGGGDTPIAAGNGVTANGQPCPNSGALPTASQLPAWYAATGLTQGPNVVAANACTTFHTTTNTCYVFTDRGTYDYLATGTAPAGPIPNLTVLTRENSASAPGGANELINYFHAYIINPSKPGETVDVTAAQDFLNLLTSPQFQAQLKHYIPNTDPVGPPFVADASPNLSVKFPSTYKAGKPLNVTGTLVNAEPGYPVLVGKSVTVDEIEGGLPVPIGHGTTSSTGSFSIKVTPPSSGTYEVTTPQIAQIEDPSLNPVFGDLLSPSASTPVHVTVQGAVTSLKAKGGKKQIKVSGKVAPGTGHHNASVTVYVKLVGAKGPSEKVGSEHLTTNQSTFSLTPKVNPGSYEVKVVFQDPSQIQSGTKVTKATVT